MTLIKKFVTSFQYLKLSKIALNTLVCNFCCRLRSDGVNYVRDFLSQAAGVSQFADGGIKVGNAAV